MQIPPADRTGARERLAALSLVQTGRLYDLDCGRWPGMPGGSVHPPFQVVGYRTSRGLRNQGDQLQFAPNAANVGWNTELLLATMHTGTHVDALSHITCGSDDHWFGGGRAETDYGDFGPLTHDATSIPSIIARGVLLDIAGLHGVAALEARTPIEPADLKQALERQQVELRPGDVVLIRTGYLGIWPDTDRIQAHKGAGITLAAAELLLEAGCIAVGSDTEALEQLPSSDPANPLPVHVRLLVESGVFILEMVDCEELARDRVHEFCFICLPLKIRGATGSFLRPVALI